METEATGSTVLEGAGITLLHYVVMGWSDIVDAEIFGVTVSCMLVRWAVVVTTDVPISLVVVTIQGDSTTIKIKHEHAGI